MRIQQIRNATMIISYGGKRFLIDPMFAPKDAFPPIENYKVKWPINDLPISPEKIIEDLDVIIMTHYHIDHFDEDAVNTVHKGIKVIVQDEYDKGILQKLGFTNLEVLTEEGTTFAGTRLYKTHCQHGVREKVMPYLGQMRYDSMGVVFKHEEEKTLYLAGDTIWCEEVKKTIDRFTPDYIILNCADAQIGDSGPLIMNAQDVKSVHEYIPKAKLIASHLDCVGHANLDRKGLKKFVKDNKFSDSVLIPKDGEEIKL